MASRPIESAGLGSFLLRALAWAGVSAALLVGGLYALGALLIAIGNHRAGTSLGPMQIAALHAIFLAIVLEALFPHWILTVLTWLALVRFAPRLDRAWRSLVPGLAAVAALWFPVVGFLLYRVWKLWKPAGPADVAKTWLLMTGGVAAALLLPRRLAPPLAPGSFAEPAGRSTLPGE
ncbi:MAG TPA: hypothetical protein DEP35_09530 [Deltaproteobacteria bacterium]|nr:hypothetical protein [Deltaproteobacteria bacterium]